MTAEDDKLGDSPPHPSARKASKLSMPKTSSDPSAVLGMSGNPASIVMSALMQIQKLVQQITPHAPQIAQIFAPAIAQGRDLAAASLADLIQGGTGVPAQDAGAPPPPGAAGPAGGGAGLPTLPPPPPM